jgi:hypothetical protein
MSTVEVPKEVAEELHRLHARVIELEEALGQALGYIVCAIPTKCDTAFVRELSNSTGVAPIN